MNFSDFSGLGSLPERLRVDFSGDRHVNAYLFAGPMGTGKTQMAAICARALNCVGAQKPCDACPSCIRALAGTHPDITTIAPDEKKDSISVDEVRKMIGRVMIRPFEGGKHAVIINPADMMMTQAQNALLKTLESGPQSAVFFLIASRPARLLPTILSRCRVVRFHAIDERICADVLVARGVDAGQAALLSRAGMGCVGRALALWQDEEYWALRERVIEALAAVCEPGGMSVAQKLLKDDKDRAEDVLEIVEGIGRELMLAREGNIAKDIALAGVGIDGASLLGAALEARERTASNVVWINVIENLFLKVGQRWL